MRKRVGILGRVKGGKEDRVTGLRLVTEGSRVGEELRVAKRGSVKGRKKRKG